jgi:uncharacterized protein (UPF0218 family)
MLVIEPGVQLPHGVTLHLPKDMRDELRVPLGPVLDEGELAARIDPTSSIATVGDMCTETLHRLGVPIKLAIVDFKTRRHPDGMWREALTAVGDVTILVGSPAGTIHSELYNIIIKSWACGYSVKIVVDGEEDLAALPAILHAPGGATVIYGIPDKGLALVQVDDKIKDVVSEALTRFEARD